MIVQQVPVHDVVELAEKHSDICIVVPVINEGDRIRKQLKRMSSLEHGLDTVIADGGSTDGSVDVDVLGGLGVRTLLTKKGTGRLSAQLRMAFAYALQQGYTGVITIDGNGKDGVEAIPRFASALRDGFDFVQGSRFAVGGTARNTPLSRLLAIKLVHVPLTRISARQRYTDTTNGFRGHSARLLSDPRVSVFRDVFATYELLAYLPIRAAQLDLRVTELPVRRIYPEGAVPTKIHSLSGHASLLAILARAVLGAYNPQECGLPPPSDRRA